MSLRGDSMIAGEREKWELGWRRDTGNVYHHLARFFFPAPSLQLSSMSDESLALLYLSLSDEVELMATFTPADVISVLRLGSRSVGYLLGASVVQQHTHMNTNTRTYVNAHMKSWARSFYTWCSHRKLWGPEISRVCLKEWIAAFAESLIRKLITLLWLQVNMKPIACELNISEKQGEVLFIFTLQTPGKRGVIKSIFPKCTLPLI